MVGMTVGVWRGGEGADTAATNTRKTGTTAAAASAPSFFFSHRAVIPNAT